MTLTSTGAAAGAGVGAYSIVPSAPTGGSFAQFNYTNIFVNGTLNVLAPPPLSIKGNAAQFTLTFQAMPGQSYQPQIANNLTGSPFAPFGTAISGTNGTVNVTNNTVGAPERILPVANSAWTLKKIGKGERAEPLDLAYRYFG